MAIEGAKGVGKTRTAMERANTVRRLDDPVQRSTAESELDTALEGDPPVLLDEWQLVPALWDKVRRAVDDGAAPGSYVLTGSAAPTRTGTHSGAGRILSLRMRPLSLVERFDQPPVVSLRALLSGERDRVRGETDVRLADYCGEILRSGFPGIRALDGWILEAQLDSYLARVVDREFPEMGREVRYPDTLRRWMTAYAAATGTTATFETIRNAAGGFGEPPPARDTVLPYRDVLARLFILEEVPGWQSSRNPIAAAGLPSKHHLADPALAARLLGATAGTLLAGQSSGPAVARDGTLLGALFESLVTQSVRTYAQAAHARVGHLRTHRGRHEIDLIVERADGKVVAIEVKLGGIPDDRSVRHIGWLAGEIGADLLDAVVITTGPQAYRRQDGIAVVPAALLGP